MVQNNDLPKMLYTLTPKPVTITPTWQKDFADVIRMEGLRCREFSGLSMCGLNLLYESLKSEDFSWLWPEREVMGQRHVRLCPAITGFWRWKEETRSQGTQVAARNWKGKQSVLSRARKETQPCGHPDF